MNETVRPPAIPTGTATAARFTTREFLAMLDAGAFADMTVELIDGELQRIPPAGNDHGRRQAMVAFRLAGACGEALVRVEAGIALGDDTLVAADVAILTRAVEGSRMLTAADMALVVEIAETTVLRDTTVKRIAYAAAQIATYWVVDAARRVVHVYREPIDGDYADIATVRFGQTLAIPGTDATIVID